MNLASDWSRLLPYLLVVVTVALVVRSFFEDRRTVRRWLAVGSGAMLIALIASISVNFGDEPTKAVILADGPSTTIVATSTTLVTGTAVPANVQGAVETRADFDRIVACETALAQIAEAIRQTASDSPVTVPDAAALTPAQQDPDRRLQSCEVRLQAIAATLPG